jgi:hypothetical protein
MVFCLKWREILLDLDSGLGLRLRLTWSGVEWSGVEWSGVEWSGVEWSGVEWSGVENGERRTENADADAPSKQASKLVWRGLL